MEAIRFNNLGLEPSDCVETCIICGSPYVQHHHIFGGTARRRISDRYGFIVPLCQYHHTGAAGVHRNRRRDLELKMLAQACGWTLAHAHARTGDRFAIAAYLGKSDKFDRAIAGFADAYADQNELDYQRFMEAYEAGQLA